MMVPKYTGVVLALGLLAGILFPGAAWQLAEALLAAACVEAFRQK